MAVSDCVAIRAGASLAGGGGARCAAAGGEDGAEMSRRLLTLALVVTTLAGGVLVGAAADGTAAVASLAPGRCSPRLSARLAAFAQAHRGVAFAVAVHDFTSGTTYGYRRHTQQRTASIVKVEILEALLHAHPRGLPSGLTAVAKGMIERSDNGDAQQLYQRVGRARGLRRFGRLVVLRETAPAGATGPGYAWGLTLTSPDDQLRLLALLTRPNPLLTDLSRHFALRLMKHVEADQRWGVTSGTGDSQVALKNGWLPLKNWTSDWQINSIGSVHGRFRRYLIAIESHGADTMDNGIALVDQASRLVARACS